MHARPSAEHTRKAIFSRARWLAAFLVTFVTTSLAFVESAHAYTWMIRHGYGGCVPCHADPSGAGALTAYGRAQGDVLLRSRYGDSSEEASPAAGFLWGAINLPEQLRIGADLRAAYLTSKLDRGALAQRTIIMRTDLYGDAKFGRLRLAGSIGYSREGALDSAITRDTRDNLVSREHWIGYELDEDATWLVRAGRIALPFGIRNVEHTFWVRELTRTNLQDDQQHGLALSFAKDWIRGEVMGIAGNLQLRPDDYRERGYSAFVEVAPSTHLAIGASSLFTRANRDIYLRVTNYRQAHGLFVRYAPVPSVVLLAEVDWVYQSLTWHGHRSGFAGLLQADFEPTQGVHLMLAGEAKNDGAADQPSSFGGWASVAWFFGRHVDLRLDDIYQRLGSTTGGKDAFSLLLQIHAYL